MLNAILPDPDPHGATSSTNYERFREDCRSTCCDRQFTSIPSDPCSKGGRRGKIEPEGYSGERRQEERGDDYRARDRVGVANDARSHATWTLPLASIHVEDLIR
jgi:hypothetical protein